MVSKFTIPETAFDPSIYTTRKSSLLRYLINLTNTSALSLVLIYLISYLGIKPLLDLTSSRRLDLLEKCRHKLRDIYLAIIGHVDHIPITGFNKNGVVVCDAILQTDTAKDPKDKLGQFEVLTKLKKLDQTLRNCTSYTVGEIPHYKLVRSEVKSFQGDIDIKLFNYDDLYKVKDRNLVVDIRNDIRSLKGSYMRGKR